MYLFGASGHAKVVIDILENNNIPIDALFDDNDAIKTLLGYPVFSSKEVKSPLIISIGNNLIRQKLAQSLDVTFAVAIHSSAIISNNVKIQEGTVVMQGAIIQSCSEIGKHCIINTGASIDHDCVIENYVHISPHATLCGNVKVGEGAWIGAGAIIIPGVEIGKWSVIGAGSVVTRSIPDNSVAYGMPCKVVGKNNN
jgi:sugar O-acyltransferase (sialic acid O-acetyltransferase NeuD family)